MFFLLLVCVTTYGQEKRKFTPLFQKMTSENTDFERTYFFEKEKTTIVDSGKNTLKHKGEVYGLSSIEKVNAFAWYCISHGSERDYKDYFRNVHGSFVFYDDERKRSELIVRKGKLKYGQLWTNEGAEVLVDGNGINKYDTDDGEETVYETYKDSLLTVGYSVRKLKMDTIYRTIDKMASPKEGIPDFIQNVGKAIKYPGIARLLGKEGRVYVSFVVDESGKLIDFKPLSDEGYRFEDKTIKKLEQFPKWNPALLNNRAVKMRFVLPVNFELR